MGIFSFFKKKAKKNHIQNSTRPKITLGCEKVDTRYCIIESTPLAENKIFGLTDKGMIRDNNEDFFVIAPTFGLYIVADGMGGHAAGEVASKEVCKLILSYFMKKTTEIKFNKKNIKNMLYNVFQKAHNTILSIANQDHQYEGMGTTLLVALIHEDRLYISHIGDVRAYLWNKDNLKQMTEDHSVVWQLIKTGTMTKEDARHSNMKAMITQAIGMNQPIVNSFVESNLIPGNKIILCSDGLWEMLSDNRIAEIVSSGRTAKEITENLVQEANNAGGHDNITIITYIH